MLLLLLLMLLVVLLLLLLLLLELRPAQLLQRVLYAQLPAQRH